MTAQPFKPIEFVLSFHPSKEHVGSRTRRLDSQDSTRLVLGPAKSDARRRRRRKKALGTSQETSGDTPGTSLLSQFGRSLGGDEDLARARSTHEGQDVRDRRGMPSMSLGLCYQMRMQEGGRREEKGRSGQHRLEETQTEKVPFFCIFHPGSPGGHEPIPMTRNNLNNLNHLNN